MVKKRPLLTATAISGLLLCMNVSAAEASAPTLRQNSARGPLAFSARDSRCRNAWVSPNGTDLSIMAVSGMSCLAAKRDMAKLRNVDLWGFPVSFRTSARYRCIRLTYLPKLAATYRCRRGSRSFKIGYGE